MSRIFALVTVLLLALALLPAEEAPARAGGGEQYGDGAPSSGSGGGGGGGGGRSGGGGGGGGAVNLPGVLGVIVVLWVITAANPPLGIGLMVGFVVLAYVVIKVDDRVRRKRRERARAERIADEAPEWPKAPKKSRRSRLSNEDLHAEAVVAAAVAAMLVDGKIAEAEYELLQRLSKRHGISREALDRLVHSLEMGALPADDVTRGVPRQELLAVVRDVIAADGVADPKEVEMVDALARKLA